MFHKISSSIRSYAIRGINMVVVVTLLGMNVNAQETEGLKKYVWYVDFAQMGDMEYMQMLHQKYPHKINEEKIEETTVGLILDRLVYNSEAEFIVLEKREWNWGGVFYVENGEKLTLTEYVARQNELTKTTRKQ